MQAAFVGRKPRSGVRFRFARNSRSPVVLASDFMVLEVLVGTSF